jgi:DNA primase
MDNSLKDKVLEAIDIVDVVGERVALTRKGKDYVGLCPFHPDHRPSFSVSPAKKIFKCWSCGVGGDVIRFVEKFERVDFRAALLLLAARAGIQLQQSPADRQSSQAREGLLATVTWAREHFQHNLRSTSAGARARDYALSRGLTAETIQRFGLGFAPDGWDDLLQAAQRKGIRAELLNRAGLVATNDKGKTYDRFRNRLIFPIADPSGRTIAFGGRTLGDDPAKYLNSPETVLFSKSRVLYGLDLARRAIQKQDAAIVVEGYMDAVLLSQFGFEHVVATLGTAMTDAHGKLLRPLACTLYLCFDGDEAGLRAADRAAEVALHTQVQVRVVVLETYKDPADCLVAAGAAGFAAQLNRAVDALEFKWSKALTAFGRGDQRGRRAAVEEFIRFVAGATVSGGIDPLQQNLLVGRLSDLLGVPAEDVFDLLVRERHLLRQPQAGGLAAADGSVSDYEVTIRGLSAGLVTAMESVFGLLLTGATCWPLVDDVVACGTDRSETWRRLYGLLLEVHANVGDYSIGDVVSRCDDSALCELVSRARTRVAGSAPGAEAFSTARNRLAEEMGVLRVGDLRDDLRRSGGEDEAAFRALLASAREAASSFSVETRLSARAASVKHQGA